ncbi:MAG: isochorismatase [Chloroflexota bacterium]
MKARTARELPIPPHFAPEKVNQVWRVPYEQRAVEAEAWALQHNIRPAAEDSVRVCLLAVDAQNTFCIPEFELFVGGRSGSGAVDDNCRLAQFIYRNLESLTHICPTLDTHQPIQIFHSIFLVNDKGEHPPPFALVSADDVQRGVWKFNPAVARGLQITAGYGQELLRHYTGALKGGGKYDLTIWPYHAMLGGIGHALVSSIEEAVFFHSIARRAQPDFQIKGNQPFTEHYSALGPEVLMGPGGKPLAKKNSTLVELLLTFDAVVVAGQAKSHCVAWTVDDLLAAIGQRDESLTRKIYLLEDCTSPVVVPGTVDYTDQADAAFERFASAGMNIVRSTDPIANWPGIFSSTASRGTD